MSWHLTIINKKGKEIASYGSIQMVDSDYYRLQGTHRGARRIAFFIKNFRIKYDTTGEHTAWVKSELISLCKKGNYIRVY